KRGREEGEAVSGRARTSPAKRTPGGRVFVGDTDQPDPLLRLAAKSGSGCSIPRRPTRAPCPASGGSYDSAVVEGKCGEAQKPRTLRAFYGTPIRFGGQ